MNSPKKRFDVPNNSTSPGTLPVVGGPLNGKMMMFDATEGKNFDLGELGVYRLYKGHMIWIDPQNMAVCVAVFYEGHNTGRLWHGTLQQIVDHVKAICAKNTYLEIEKYGYSIVTEEDF
jgi:hypothetical protein